MENKTNFQDMINLLAERADISNNDAEIFLKEFFHVVSESLSDTNPVKIKDFGSFKLTSIQSRESVDVNTGEKNEIPAHNKVSFSPATALKDLVNKPFAHFETTLLHAGFDAEGMRFDNSDWEDDTEPEEQPGNATQLKKNIKSPLKNIRREEEKKQPFNKQTELNSSEVIQNTNPNNKPIFLVILSGFFIAGISCFLNKKK